MSSPLDLFQTSLEINSAILFLCVSAFTLLRTARPDIYSPRVILRNAIPLPSRSLSWLTLGVMATPDLSVNDAVGLDAYILVKFMRMCTGAILSVSVFGLAVVLPINMNGGNGLGQFEQYSIANVKDGSELLWGHAVVVWCVSGVFLYYLKKMYDEYGALRHKHLCLPGPKQYSVIVQDLPDNLTDDESIARYFLELYNRAVYSAHILKNTTMLDELVEKRDIATHNLAHVLGVYIQTGNRPTTALIPPLRGLSSDSEKEKGARGKSEMSIYDANDGSPEHANSHLGVKQKIANHESDDAIEYWGMRVHELNCEISARQKLGVENTRSAIISFNTLQASAMCSQVQHSASVSQMFVSPAPDPADIITENLTVDRNLKASKVLLSNAALFFMVFFFSVPVAFISSLSNLDALANQSYFIKVIVDSLSPYAKSLLEGLLPPVLLSVLLSFLPSILIAMSSFEGLSSTTEVERAATDKFFIFQLVNAFLIYLVSGSVLSSINGIIEQPSSVVSVLAQSVPSVSSFFINFVMLQAMSGFSFELLRLVPLLLSTYSLHFNVVNENERYELMDPGGLSYVNQYPNHLLILIITLTYCSISPLVLPFGLLYFAFGYAVMKNQLMYVYIAKVDSGGLFWPQVFSRSVIGLVVCQLSMIGILGSKLAAAQSTILVPLPFITAYFWYFYTNKYERIASLLPIEKAVRNEIQQHSPDFNLHFLLNAYVQKSLRVRPTIISLDLLFPPISKFGLKSKVLQELQNRADLMKNMQLGQRAINELPELLPRQDSNDQVVIAMPSPIHTPRSQDEKVQEHDFSFRKIPPSQVPESLLTSVANKTPGDSLVAQNGNITEDFDDNIDPGKMSLSTEVHKYDSYQNDGLIGALAPSLPAILPAQCANAMELIHAQGLQCPPLHFHLVKDPEDPNLRPYFSLPLVPLDDNSSPVSLCCRKKMNEDKYRFVIGASNLTKKGNPNYIGKMTRIENVFTITLSTGMVLAEITFAPLLTKCAVQVKILNRYVNVREIGPGGSIFTGVQMLQVSGPILSLVVESANRPVLEIYDSQQFGKIADKEPLHASSVDTARGLDVNARYVADFDYPMTIFLVFAILCALHAKDQK